MSVISVVGARPNFIKMAPVIDELDQFGINNLLVHTGQHYDKNMSDSFFNDLEIQPPDISLGVGSGSHASQTAKIMTEFEKVCIKTKPKLVIVAGDVNSTMACALVASKLNISLAHVESGLRSYDRRMPEEINRLITDQLSDLLFVTEKSGTENLKQEGINEEKVFFVGNSMIDSTYKYIDKAIEKKPWKDFGFFGRDYCLVTLHRPSNVDDVELLKKTVSILNDISTQIPIIFPIHPRTLSHLEKNNIILNKSIIISKPLNYIRFLGLISKSKLVITDSGGVQEETSYLSVQCITYRENTERPITLDLGTNHLVNPLSGNLLETFNNINNGNLKRAQKLPSRDGKSANRIVKIIKNHLSSL